MYVRATGGVPLTGDMRDAAASCPLSAARRTATQLPSLSRSARRVRRPAAFVRLSAFRQRLRLH